MFVQHIGTFVQINSVKMYVQLSGRRNTHSTVCTDLFHWCLLTFAYKLVISLGLCVQTVEITVGTPKAILKSFESPL